MFFSHITFLFSMMFDENADLYDETIASMYNSRSGDNSKTQEEMNSNEMNQTQGNNPPQGDPQPRSQVSFWVSIIGLLIRLNGHRVPVLLNLLWGIVATNLFMMMNMIIARLVGRNLTGFEGSTTVGYHPLLFFDLYEYLLISETFSVGIVEGCFVMTALLIECSSKER